MDNKNQKRKVEKIDKQILGIFVFVGVVAIILGFLQFKQNLSSAFRPYYPDYNKLSEEETQTQELLALKQTDSDNDGLNDYDELYQYGTSPYVSDSDSDGLADGEEISSGADPNCPQGKNCVLTETTKEEVAQETGAIKADEITSEQLREILLQNGVPQATLDALDDESLMKMYQESLLETNTAVGEEPVDTNSSNTDDPYADLLPENVNSAEDLPDTTNLEDLTAAEVRQLLINTGDFTEADLSDISDEQLMTIFQNSIQ